MQNYHIVSIVACIFLSGLIGTGGYFMYESTVPYPMINCTLLQITRKECKVHEDDGYVESWLKLAGTAEIAAGTIVYSAKNNCPQDCRDVDCPITYQIGKVYNCYSYNYKDYILEKSSSEELNMSYFYAGVAVIALGSVCMLVVLVIWFFSYMQSRPDKSLTTYEELE